MFYPVPDGDTGTNMSMTLQSVENALIGLQTEPKMEELVDIISEAVSIRCKRKFRNNFISNYSRILR